MAIQELQQVGTSELQSFVFFVHAEGRAPKVVRATPSESLAEIVRRAGIELIEGMHVFVGECVDALAVSDGVECGEDTQLPVPNHHDAAHAHGHHHGGHIHCHRCHRIQTVVMYNGQEKRHGFSPATTVATVRQWAIKKFHLSHVDAETLILKICGVDKPPQTTAHLGELTLTPHCEICFELVPDQRING